MKKIILLLAFLAFITYACSDDDDNTDNKEPCTLEFVSGLVVKVTNATTGTALGTGITVTATDGTYVDQLDFFSATSEFTGAGERAGTYTITISGDGYQPYVSQPVTVTEDECHVITQTLTVALQPTN